MRIKLLLIILLIISCQLDEVDEVDEVDGLIDQTVIKKEIDQAADGDTILVPPGICIIDKTIVFSKNITLKGAGIDKTIIISNFTEFNTQPFYFIGSSSSVPDSFRVTGMTFKSEISDNDSNFIYIDGNSKKFRIDHCKFTLGGAHSIMIDGDTYGVIDHCIFDNDSQESISIRNTVEQDNIWSAAPSMPMAANEAVFIEDCEFNFITKGTHAVTSVNGAKFVFRYNTVNSKINGALVDAHGNFENDRSNYSAEVYNNILNNLHTSQYISYGIYIRGGKAIICDNVLNGRFSYPVTLTNYRSWTSSLQYPSAGAYVDPDDGRTYNPNITTWVNARSLSDSIRDTYCWNNRLTGRMIDPADPAGNSMAVNNAAVDVSVLKRGYDNLHITLGTDYYQSNPGYSKAAYPHPLNTD
jgi:hypothetical protein